MKLEGSQSGGIARVAWVEACAACQSRISNKKRGGLLLRTPGSIWLAVAGDMLPLQNDVSKLVHNASIILRTGL